jgi:cell division protein ZapA
MATLHIAIYGRDYQVACDDGEEEHLRMLAHDLDDRVRQLGYRMGSGPENLMLVLTSLTMVDEINDLRRELEQARGGAGFATRRRDPEKAAEQENKVAQMEAAMAMTLEEISLRIEKIAEQIEVG